MKILVLAPQPFFVERGTPIAVRLLVRTLVDLGHDVDLLTFHEGRDVDLGGARLLRTPAVPGVRGISPGFSGKKVVCDLAMAATMLGLLARNRYDFVHAVEESVFLAATLGRVFGVPFVYDMDSSLPEQLSENYEMPETLTEILRAFEALAIRHSAGVAAVCQALADRVSEVDEGKTVALLRDISLVRDAGVDATEITDLREELSIDGPILLYVGNLEPYQGIDLMLEAFALAAREEASAHLVVIGGASGHIDMYREEARSLDVSDRVHFVGPRPLGHLGDYLTQADVLVSPRIKGTNTPMKIYSYMDAGVPILATRLPTHEQVLDDGIAELAAARPREFASAMLDLIREPARRVQLGEAARIRVEEHHSYDAYRRTLGALYERLGAGSPAPA